MPESIITNTSRPVPNQPLDQSTNQGLAAREALKFVGVESRSVIRVSNMITAELGTAVRGDDRPQSMAFTLSR